jgi:hypothetical protein
MEDQETGGEMSNLDGEEVADRTEDLEGVNSMKTLELLGDDVLRLGHDEAIVNVGTDDDEGTVDGLRVDANVEVGLDVPFLHYEGEEGAAPFPRRLLSPVYGADELEDVVATDPARVAGRDLDENVLRA